MITKKLLLFVTALLVLLAASCADNGIDDGSSANVVLEVDQVTLAVITSTFDPLRGVCVFQVTDSTVTLSNIPKSEGAGTEPFNDILIDQMIISYVWDDGLAMPNYVTSPRVVIPANSSNQVRFLPVQLAEFLSAVPSREGHSAEVTLLFQGEVGDGSRVQAVGGGALFVNSCVVSGP
jgi:hypothetical protein